MTYIGRFAPSPTGPLHFGSLVAALASYLDARHHKGTWLLRIEDLDPPRESSTAPDEIMAQLRALGLTWDGEVLYQSTRLDAYAAALKSLDDRHLTYPCTCTRKSVSVVYPGTCRNRKYSQTPEPYAVRLRAVQPGTHQEICFADECFGDMKFNLARDLGDFIIRRKDSLFAYQLAVVVDDAWQGVNKIVRGADLLDSTPRQLALYQALNLPPPDYLHIPIITDAEGHKLSKQACAPPVTVQAGTPEEDKLGQLRAALRMLGQPEQPQAQGTAELLEKAARDWLPERIPRQRTLTTVFSESVFQATFLK